ncbi:MAG: diguanylate cyclase [Pseudomonadota bacterium]|nr:diguanylate cyclase [Pseudomonadota bacterium]
MPWRHRLPRARWLALALCATLALPAAAAPARWASTLHSTFKHVLGDATSSATAFAQDATGFVWIGSQAGLVRWDGVRGRRYVADPGRTDTLADSYILSLLVDHGGRLWVGTSAGGLAGYDAGHGNFVRYPAGPGGISAAGVAALADDGRGGIWIGTGAGLDHLGADGVVERAADRARAAGAGQLPAGRVDALLLDRAGRLWIGSQHGLFMRAGDGAAPRRIPFGMSDKAPNVSVLFEDSAGRIWIGTPGAGAYRIEAGEASAQPVFEFPAGPDRPVQLTDRVRAITESGADAIWIATEGGGIVEIDPLHASSRRIRHQPDVPDSLFDDDVTALFRERSGVVFVGAILALSQHNPQPAAFLTIRQSGLGAGAKLSVPSMLTHPDGTLWLGLATGGVDIIDPRHGAVGRLAPGAGDAGAALPKGRVLAMTNGRDGAVYLGTQQGLYLVDAARRDVRRIEIAQRGVSAAVWALAYEDGMLWVGGLDGLWALDATPGHAHRLLRHEADTLGDMRVTALLPDGRGALWIGTKVGLARLASIGGALEQVPGSGTDASRMPIGYVSSLLFDRQGRLWASSFGAGIAVLERTDGAGRRWFRHIGGAEGLQHNGVNKLLMDGAGAIWASTDDGLARIDSASFATRMLRGAEGVNMLGHWTNSGTANAAGELIFGGSAGITVVTPSKLAPAAFKAPLAITEIRLNDRALPVGPYNQAAPALARPIEVAPAGRERGFSVEFAALDYAAADRSVYSYRLNGFDRDWIGADAVSRRISYTNLPPGDYSLQLRASSRGQAWSAPLALPVRVLPVWHQIAWVRVAAALGALGVLVALVQLRTGYLRRRQQELQEMVNARTAELRATQSQLEKLAYADPLTGLPNRRLFTDDMRQMAARAMRDGEQFTLLLIDLDYFKQINDTLGHDAGDALLVEAAARLKQVVREADRLSRLGGDEFAVLLANTADRETVSAICQRIVAGIGEAIEYQGSSMRVSASIGAATFACNGGGVDDLYKAADTALYQAKRAGRATFRWHAMCPAAAAPVSATAHA